MEEKTYIKARAIRDNIDMLQRNMRKIKCMDRRGDTLIIKSGEEEAMIPIYMRQDLYQAIYKIMDNHARRMREEFANL